MTRSYKGHSPVYTQHLPVLMNVQKFLVVLVHPVSSTAPGSLSSHCGLVCSAVRLSIFPLVKDSTVEPVNPDSGKSGHLHITDIKLLSRIFLYLKLVFRHLKIRTPLYSVIRTATYSPVTSLVRKITCTFQTMLNNIILKTDKNAFISKKQHIYRIQSLVVVQFYRELLSIFLVTSQDRENK